jgi:hypothetical protein
MGECCICRNLYKDFDPEKGLLNYLCARCGKVKCTANFYEIMFGAVTLTEGQKANACGWVRENPGYLLDMHDLEFIQNIPTPTVEEKANKLLLHISTVPILVE